MYQYRYIYAFVQFAYVRHNKKLRPRFRLAKAQSIFLKSTVAVMASYEVGIQTDFPINTGIASLFRTD